MTAPGAGAGGESGYAMIAAILAVALFAALGLEAASGGRAAVVQAGAESVRARLAADADAGLALAEHGLGMVDPARRWNAAGDLRTLDFQGDTLTIGVENEGGKIPLNFIQAPEARRMFALAGATDGEADDLARAFLALRDGPGGAGPLTAIDELALLAGMTPALYARLAPEVTVDAATLSFDPALARPLALAVMAPGLAPQALRPAAGTPAPAGASALAGRAFTIRVDVDDGRGGRLRRSAVVELTGASSMPVVVRRVD